LSDEILFGRLYNGGNVFIDVDNEKLTFNYNVKASLSKQAKELETSD